MRYFIKRLCFVVLALLVLAMGMPLKPAQAAGTLQAGDLAVIGLNADDSYPDQRWALVALAEIPAGAVIHITDAGITNTGEFYVNSLNEGHLTWTVGASPVPAGTVLAMSNLSGTGGLTTYGSVSGQIGGTTYGFTAAGDQIDLAPVSWTGKRLVT